MFLFRLPKRIIRKIYRKIRGERWCTVKDRKAFFSYFGYNIYDKDHKFHVEGKGLNISGLTQSTFNVSEEVLCQEGYHFYIGEPYVMFDIGFNIGITSLYWAKNEYLKKIYSFEPFRFTRELGEANLQDNPELAKKIELFSFGMGGSDDELEIHYNPNKLGCMSSTDDRFNDTKNSRLEKIQIKKASDVLKPLFEKHSEKKFLKIDCEGAENEIIPDLDNAGILKDVSVIIMECHDKSPDPLIDILAKNGFNLHCERFVPQKGSMVFAKIVAFKK